MPITCSGWEFHVVRLLQQQSDRGVRTYGTYAVYRDGSPVEGLSGFICESPGPGDNSKPSTHERKRCVEAGRYQMLTHRGKYASSQYSATATTPDDTHPLPGLRLEDRGKRTFILVHPAHRPTLYLSSIGCLNPTGPREANEPMDFDDSRARTVALLDNLRAWEGPNYPVQFETKIPEAFAVIDESSGYNPPLD